MSDLRSNGDGVSLISIAATPENTVLFPNGPDSPPAYTRLFFDRRGSIIEADIVLNPFLQFSTDGTPGTYDLQAVLTHEFGHVIGLVHSQARSATMFERISPNRTESHIGLEHRTLSAADVSAARGLYGPRGVTGCCIAVFGRMTGKALGKTVVWAEEASTGRLIAAETGSGGRLELSGLEPGTYRIFAQPIDARYGSAVKIAEQEIELVGDLGTHSVERAAGVDVKFIGVNAELSNFPIRLSRGRSYQIFVGGAGLDPQKLKFGFSSRYISIASGTLFPINYAGNISAIAMNISIDAETPAGEYNLYVETDGLRRYLPGAVSVD